MRGTTGPGPGPEAIPYPEGLSRLAGEGGTPPRGRQLHAPRLNSLLAKTRHRHAPSHPARGKRVAGGWAGAPGVAWLPPPYPRRRGSAPARRGLQGLSGAVGHMAPRPRGRPLPLPLPLPSPAPAHGHQPPESSLRAWRRGSAHQRRGGQARASCSLAESRFSRSRRSLRAWPTASRLSPAPAWDAGNARAPARLQQQQGRCVGTGRTRVGEAEAGCGRERQGASGVRAGS